MSKKTIATIRKDDQERNIIVFDGYVDSVILKDGSRLDLSDKRTFFLNDSVERANFLLENNYMDKLSHDKEMAFIEKNNVIAHLVVPVVKG